MTTREIELAFADATIRGGLKSEPVDWLEYYGSDGTLYFFPDPDNAPNEVGTSLWWAENDRLCFQYPPETYIDCFLVFRSRGQLFYVAEAQPGLASDYTAFTTDIQEGDTEGFIALAQANAGPSGAELGERIYANDIWFLIADFTVDGYDGQSGTPFLEYYSPDGFVYYYEDEFSAPPQVGRGDWWVDHDLVCFAYPDAPDAVCYELYLDGQTLVFHLLPSNGYPASTFYSESKAPGDVEDFARYYDQANGVAAAYLDGQQLLGPQIEGAIRDTTVYSVYQAGDSPYIEYYAPDGHFYFYWDEFASPPQVDRGTWSVEGDALCTYYSDESNLCFEVWDMDGQLYLVSQENDLDVYLVELQEFGDTHGFVDLMAAGPGGITFDHAQARLLDGPEIDSLVRNRTLYVIDNYDQNSYAFFDPIGNFFRPDGETIPPEGMGTWWVADDELCVDDLLASGVGCAKVYAQNDTFFLEIQYQDASLPLQTVQLAYLDIGDAQSTLGQFVPRFDPRSRLSKEEVESLLIGQTLHGTSTTGDFTWIEYYDPSGGVFYPVDETDQSLIARGEWYFDAGKLCVQRPPDNLIDCADLYVMGEDHYIHTQINDPDGYSDAYIDAVSFFENGDMLGLMEAHLHQGGNTALPSNGMADGEIVNEPGDVPPAQVPIQQENGGRNTPVLTAPDQSGGSNKQPGT